MATNEQLLSALNDAIQSGTIALSKEHIDELTKPFACIPLLHQAINLNLLDVATLFLDNHADPSQVDDKGSTPLHYVRNGTEALVPRLLVHNRPDKLNHQHKSALTNAILHNMISTVDLYLDANVSLDPTSFHTEEQNPYRMAIVFSRHNILNKMINRIDKENTRLEHFVPFIQLAIRLDDIPSVKLLMTLGFHGLYQIEEKQTLLHQVTTIYNSRRIFESLLDTSSHVNPVDFRGNTPLHLLCAQTILSDFQYNEINSQRLKHILALLCHRGADVLATNDEGKTAFDIAQSYSPVAQHFLATNRFHRTHLLVLLNPY